jgi:hypothetical protein
VVAVAVTHEGGNGCPIGQRPQRAFALTAPLGGVVIGEARAGVEEDPCRR